MAKILRLTYFKDL